LRSSQHKLFPVAYRSRLDALAHILRFLQENHHDRLIWLSYTESNCDYHHVKVAYLPLYDRTMICPYLTGPGSPRLLQRHKPCVQYGPSSRIRTRINGFEDQYTYPLCYRGICYALLAVPRCDSAQSPVGADLIRQIWSPPQESNPYHLSTKQI
jgi:hypothetical protein